MTDNAKYDTKLIVTIAVTRDDKALCHVTAHSFHLLVLLSGLHEQRRRTPRPTIIVRWSAGGTTSWKCPRHMLILQRTRLSNLLRTPHLVLVSQEYTSQWTPLQHQVRLSILSTHEHQESLTRQARLRKMLENLSFSGGAFALRWILVTLTVAHILDHK